MAKKILLQLTFEFAKQIQKLGGRVFFVGGINRDFFIKYKIWDATKIDSRDLMSFLEEIKDIDLEVYGVTNEQIERELSMFGDVNFVGKSYGVYKLKEFGSHDNDDIDITIPKSEKSTGKKHTDVVYETNPFMSFTEACQRRDLRMNSILIDVLTGEIIDPLKGRKDIKKKLVRATNWKVFVTDPLRVIRAIQFSSRFRFKISFGTRILCMVSDISHLPKERIYEEFNKILLKSQKPSMAFENMRKLGLLKNFPLLRRLSKTPQSRKHHKEGNAWKHTMLVLDEAAKVKHLSKDPLTFMWAALLHDIGKITATRWNWKKFRFVSYDHQTDGEKLSVEFLQTLTNEVKMIEKVATLVRHHMEPLFLQKSSNVSDAAFRRLSCKVDLQELHLLSLCDRLGRKGVNVAEEIKGAEWFKERSEAINCFGEKPQPLVLGRDILELGIKPGPKVGEMLKKAFDLQMEGFSKEQIMNTIKG